MLTLHLDKDVAEMARLADKVQEWCVANGLADLSPVLNVVLDEAVSNAIHYGMADGIGRGVEVRLALAGDRVRVEVIDDGIAFNPLALPDPDTSLDIDERGIGGLGVFLVKSLMDHVHYAREGGFNHLTLEKAI